MAYTTTKLVADENTFVDAVALAGTNLGTVSTQIIAWKKAANERLAIFGAASTVPTAKSAVTT